MPELRVHRDDLSQCEVVEVQPQDRADGEARLEVERFGLTTNDTTSGEVGDRLGSWYDDLDGLDGDGRAVLVDFAGDPALTRAVHERLGDALARSIRVGSTHRGAGADDRPPPGPAPELFFAPHAMAARGRAVIERFMAEWAAFLPVLEAHQRIERVRVADEVVRAYRDLLAGRVDPSTSTVASLADEG